MDLVERVQYCQYVNNIRHIMYVIEERINLFEKRKLEVKRYLKATHRGNMLPQASSMFILLDAEIRFVINKSIFQVLTNLILGIQENDQLPTKTIEDDSKLQYEQLIQLLLSDTIIIKNFGTEILNSQSEIAPFLLEAETLSLFLQVILNPNEEYQRKQLSGYIQEFSHELLQVILERITIFDNDFLANTNKLLQEYLKVFKYS
jgi:hypothetical protein